MDAVLKWFQSLFEGPAWVVILVALIVIAVFGFVFFKVRYRIVEANQILVITGGKKGMRLEKGGTFVSFFEKAAKFSLGNMTLRSEEQETQTSTKVPIVVMWNAQIRPDTVTEGALEKAVRGYIGYSNEEEIKDSLRSTLDGEIRQVIATMTPDEVIVNKEQFSNQVTDNVSKKMTDLGFELVSLNITEVSDKNGYYSNLAAADREAMRQSAETLTANANQEIAVAQAKADQVSQSADLDKQLAVAEKSRDVQLRQASFDQETAAARGQVTVVEAQQQQAAATAQQQVAVTEAETTRKTVEIQAQSSARKAEIDAQAAGTVAKTQASAAAEAVKIEAQGQADAINITTNAEAEQVRARGQAEADAARARGEAEAAAILATGKAQAETERLMAEALAASEGVNKDIRLAEIVTNMQISIATAQAQAVGNIGEKVTIVDMGAGAREGGGGVLTNLLADLPGALQRSDIQSQLLGGAPLGVLVGSLLDGLKGAQSGETLGPIGLRPAADKPASEVETSEQPATPAVKKPASPAPKVPAVPAPAPVDTSAPKASASTKETIAEPVVPSAASSDDSDDDKFTVDDAVDALETAADVAPQIVDQARGLRDTVTSAVKQAKAGKGK